MFWEHQKEKDGAFEIYDFMGATKTDGLETRFFLLCIYIYIHVICFLSFFVCEDCKTKQNIYGVLDVFFLEQSGPVL